MTKNLKKMAVFAILQQQDEGISLPELLTLLGSGFSDRTTRRWLAEMVKDHLVEKTGQKSGTRYKMIRSTSSQSDTHSAYFSEKSKKSLNYISKPLFERSPATYHPKWFNAYKHNKTAWLSEDIKKQLHAAGEKSKAFLPAGTYARHIYNRLLIDLSYNSSRLEGNTYSLLDTQRLILEGKSAQGKLDEEKIMILNHKEAIAHLVNKAHKLKIDFNTVCTLHYLLADGLVPAQYTGKVRDYGVRISGSTYIPLENPEEIKKQLQLISQKASRIKDPYEQSIFLLAHIAYLQAFSDVNKRTSRLSANIPLIKHNLVPLSFNDVSNDDYTAAMIAIYELNDVRPLVELYVYSYIRTCKLYEVTQNIVSFDEIRVRYRQQRREIIRHVIVNELTNESMNKYINSQTEKNIPSESQAAFMEDVQEDLNEISSERIAGLGITVEQLNAWLRKKNSA